MQCKLFTSCTWIQIVRITPSCPAESRHRTAREFLSGSTHLHTRHTLTTWSCLHSQCKIWTSACCGVAASSSQRMLCAMPITEQTLSKASILKHTGDVFLMQGGEAVAVQRAGPHSRRWAAPVMHAALCGRQRCFRGLESLMWAWCHAARAAKFCRPPMPLRRDF